MQSQRGKTTITVRGVDRELYEELARLARETGRNVGEMLNLAMRLLIAQVRSGLELFGRKVESMKQALDQVLEEQGSMVVSGVEELTVSRRDLEATTKPVIFKSMKKLIFGSDVDPGTFSDKVKAIVAVDEVIVPKGFPKLLVAQRCRLVKRITEAASSQETH
jgi:hypothetical protein